MIMAAKHSRHIALTAPLVAHIDSLVADGSYASISEMVRAALWLLIETKDAKALRNMPQQDAGRHDRT